MPLYQDFAYIYHQGPYTRFSQRMSEVIPSVLEKFHCRPRTLLDLACGEGSFAIPAARAGMQVTGLDRSPQMLQIARIRAAGAGVAVIWIEGDLRAIDLPASFDLATCWFDSLNYLLEPEDLEKAFAGVSNALIPGGIFIFDMNTLYGLAVAWQAAPCSIQQDTDEILEIHRPTFDFERSTASIKITAFTREGQYWQKMEEVHQERGYPIEQIRQMLKNSGFNVLACYGNLEEMSEPEPDSGRVWFVARKGGEAGTLNPDIVQNRLHTRRPVKTNRIRRG